MRARIAGAPRGISNRISGGYNARRHGRATQEIPLRQAETWALHDPHRDHREGAGVDDCRPSDRIGIDMVKHKAGSDPGAVAHDTVTAAKARGTDVVLIDTAGRLHNKSHLMQE